MLQRYRQQVNLGVTSSRGRSAVGGSKNYIEKLETPPDLYENWIGKVLIDSPRIIYTDKYISMGYISRKLYPHIFRILYVSLGTVKSIPSKSYEAYRVNLYVDVYTFRIIDIRCF